MSKADLAGARTAAAAADQTSVGNRVVGTAKGAIAQDTDGGRDYEYGAADFGDEPVNPKRIENTAEPAEAPATENS